MKRYIALLLVAATFFSLLGGCSIVNTPTKPYEEPSEEEIFTKTIYDFEGLRVDNLDGQEHTNFIVYAKGVKEISVTGQTNVLVATDYENLSYTFANPDETLLSMKKGDTFFASVSEHCPEGVTVKVKDMVTSGNQLTVYSEPLGFADLFTYIDIFMDVPLDQVMPISGTEASGSSASSSGSAPGENSESNVITIPVNQTFSDCAEFSAGGAKISHQTYVTLQYVTVALRYSREHSKVSCTVYADTIYGGQLDIEGEWAPDEWIIPLAVIPLRVAGIIAVPVELNAVISGGGKTSSHIEFKESKRLGFTASVSKQNSSYQAINEVLLPGTFENSYFGETEAELNFAMEVKPTLSAGFLGQFYASCRPGFGFYAHMAPLAEVSADKEDSSIHDCKVCIDGDINWFLDLSIGFEVKLAEKLDRKTIGDAAADILDENREQLDGQTLSVPLHFGGKVADFYVTMQDNHWVFGWGKCNNSRYKTTVTLTDSSSGAAAGAIVTAFYPDGRQEEATADSAGVAVLYLPTGESTLSGSYGKESGSGTVQVEDAPTEAELSLRENQLYISVNITSSAYSSIRNTLSSLFPDAIFTSNPYNDGAKAGDVWLDIGGGITEIPIIDPSDLQSEPHWLPAPDGLHAHLSQFTEVDDSGYYENLSVELSVHSRSYSVAPTVDPDKYGRFVECKVQASLVLVSGETFIDIFEEVVPGVDFAGVLVSDYCTNPAYQEALLHAGIPDLQRMKPYVELLLANLPIS